MSKKQAEIVIKGDVQGVNFRYYSREKASQLGLVGWVRNEEGGAVKIVAEGGEKELKNLIQWCKNGPDSANVEEVKVNWQEPRGEFNDFKIEY